MADRFPVLQVALDLMHLKRSVQIAREAVEGGADWLEAGTPLIKSEGMDAVRTLRDEFPGREIVSDLKTMDTGGFETELAARSGATINTIMGVADDGTILEAVRSGRKYGCRIMVDLLGVEDKKKRTAELEAMGVDLLCIHVSIDDQMMGRTFTEEVRELAAFTKTLCCNTESFSIL